MNAEAWFARLHSPDCSKDDEAAFDHWLRADPRNAASYQTCEALSAMSGDLRAHHALVDDLLADAGLGAGRFVHPIPNRRIRIALAAVATAAMVAIGFQLAVRLPSEAPAVVATAKGEQRQITLDDGTRIQLNTDTVLDWRMTSNERHVELTHGEAFFDVSKDPSRPFIVHAGSSEVRVVGTQFSVREDAGHLDVVVKEGRVNVVPDTVGTAGHAPTRVELTRGKRLSYDDAQNLVRVAVVDPERALIWRTGSLDFDSVTLEEAVAEVNRYASRPLVIENPDLRGLKVSGRFRVGDTEAVVFALKERFGIEAVEAGQSISLR